jgi:spermidine synthase
VLAGLYPYESPARLPSGLRYLSAALVPQMFQFPVDMLPVDAEPNRLNDQVLVRYYEHDWREITH